MTDEEHQQQLEERHRRENELLEHLREDTKDFRITNDEFDRLFKEWLRRPYAKS